MSGAGVRPQPTFFLLSSATLDVASVTRSLNPVLDLGRQRDKLLRARAKLLAERHGEFHLLGHELGRRLRAKGRLAWARLHSR